MNEEEREEMEEREESLLQSSPKRFWELVKTESGGLMLVNIAFVLSCLLLVTIPPAVFALHQVIRGMLDDKPGRVRDFFAAFRANWKRAYGAFLLAALPMAAGVCGMAFYGRFAPGNPVFWLPFMLCSTVFILVLLSSVYLYRLLVNGRRLNRETVRLAVLLAAGRPGWALLAALWYYVPLIIGILWFPLSVLYLLLIAFSVPCLLGNLVLRKVLALDERDGN
ncbi:MAG: DUF624 domain-containing protein [Oscillospiraceae bacterium]|nr:DUF624 domain-containing protein [Oscillospiraceae bacterium]